MVHCHCYLFSNLNYIWKCKILLIFLKHWNFSNSLIFNDCLISFNATGICESDIFMIPFHTFPNSPFPNNWFCCIEWNDDEWSENTSDNDDEWMRIVLSNWVIWTSDKFGLNWERIFRIEYLCKYHCEIVINCLETQNCKNKESNPIYFFCFCIFFFFLMILIL